MLQFYLQTHIHTHTHTHSNDLNKYKKRRDAAVLRNRSAGIRGYSVAASEVCVCVCVCVFVCLSVCLPTIVVITIAACS
jgi:hypothetical protein